MELKACKIEVGEAGTILKVLKLIEGRNEGFGMC